MRLVGDQQGRHARGRAAVSGGASRDGRVGDRDPVAVARLRATGVGAVGLEVDAVARGVERPLPADVRGRRDDDHALDPARGEHPVRDVEPERRLAGRGGGGGQERVRFAGGDGGRRRLLPGAQGTAGRPGGQGPAAPEGG
jgi:hypothetical protein